MISFKNQYIRRACQLLCGAAMVLLTTGCEDFFNIEPQNEIILEKFWTEKSDVMNMVAGCYSGMQSEAVVSRMMIWGEFRSENVGVGQNIDKDANLGKVLKENIDAQNAYTAWESFYQVINRCNTVIKYAPAVAADDPSYTESELKANIAEVTALRSLCYFYLIRTFRDVPYSTVAFTDDNQRMTLPATKFETVLDSLIQSLEQVKGDAVEFYPTTTPKYQTARITKDAINAMLCEMYLWKQDWDNCIKYADLVMEAKKKYAETNRSSLTSYGSTGSSQYERSGGYPLVNAYSSSTGYGYAYNTLFTSDSYVNNYTPEIVFQLTYSDDPRGESMIANMAVNTLYGNARYLVGRAAPSDYVISDIAATSSRTIFADRNKKVDARLYTNCNLVTGAINKYVTRSMTIDATSSTPKAGYAGFYNENENGANWIIYRLADIMLMKAEALVMKAQDGATTEVATANKPLLDAAFQLVNWVNKRSVCETELVDTLVRSDYASKAQMETLVLQERQRELMFEGKRYYDLVRQARRNNSTQTLSTAVQRKVTTGGALIANKLSKMDAIYWPYHYEELKVNDNLKQNSAFSSGEDSSYEKNY
jgi:lambda repressor-like predicted transcriptional regulator